MAREGVQRVRHARHLEVQHLVPEQVLEVGDHVRPGPEIPYLSLRQLCGTVASPHGGRLIGDYRSSITDHQIQGAKRGDTRHRAFDCLTMGVDLAIVGTFMQRGCRQL